MAYGSVNVPGASAKENKELANEALDKLATLTTLTIPTQSSTIYWNGEIQRPAWYGYDPNKMKMSGDIRGVNAGTSAATFTPKPGFKWSDGTTTPKTINWTIERADGKMSLSAESLTLDVFNTTQQINVVRDGRGAVSATSSSPNVAEVSVSGTTVTVKGKRDGTAKITVSVAGDENHTAVSATLTVTVERGGRQCVCRLRPGRQSCRAC